MSGHLNGAVRRRVERHRAHDDGMAEDWVAAEVPLAIDYNDAPHVVMMATPDDLADFALGFSLSEAVIATPAELNSCTATTLLEGIRLSLRIPPARAQALAQRRRNLVGNSGCGVCGTQHLEDVLRHPPRVAAAIAVSEVALQRALAELEHRQPLNALTGATHAAAWARADGSLAHVREDVGRHNALDKLIGAVARAGDDVRTGFLVVTSRASYEMVQKAATVGIGFIAAISAPTALAIHLADATGITLVGFARDDGHVVYARRSTED